MTGLRRFVVVLLGVTAILAVPPALAQDAPYLDPTLDVEMRVEDLLGRMTLDEKLGQMTLVEKNSITEESVTRFSIGGILSGGGGYPNPNTPEAWADMVDGFQAAALSTRLQIPLIYGVDAVHGHNNLSGATIFPHNVGLGAADNPELVRQIAEATAHEMIATGIYWNYAPVMAVPQDIRWGRTYEGFGEDTALVDRLSNAYLLGLQGTLGDPTSVLGTPKHYVGDGGTTWGTSDNGSIDRGDTRVDEATLRARHLAPYVNAVENGALSIMVSFSSWNGTPLHGHDFLVNEVLKGELGFDGFVVSDWGGVDLIADDYYDAVVTSVNAGVDMNMVPFNYPLYLEALAAGLENSDITLDRIDDAVRRILRAKFAMGLFEHPYSDRALIDEVGSDAHRALARQAVSESLVLLRNEDQALPIGADARVIFVAGQGADDIGMQSGGWTIEWQGTIGDSTPGTTILDGIRAAVATETAVHYNLFGRFNRVTDSEGNPVVADVGVVVIGELPYAEWFGDDAFLRIDPGDAATIERVRERSEKLVVVLLSGRPLIISDILFSADAFVAAWLPGTEGQGVADVLFGDQPFTGRLPYTWPRSIAQIPFDFENLPRDGCDAPLFPFGYGLTVEDSSSPWLDLAEACLTRGD
ncbi:MAG: glycoside hydrolase family 3 C-terminal domain-containing protein [Chloroflexi bacterium]|nr:glycoside hydrolase family 3 C-terminal domain-containing protein [Chloroflexota bacterium]